MHHCVFTCISSLPFEWHAFVSVLQFKFINTLLKKKKKKKYTVLTKCVNGWLGVWGLEFDLFRVRSVASVRVGLGLGLG